MSKTLELTLHQQNDIALHLLNGKVGVIPTDTIYGLVAVASNQQAVGKLYALKERESKPGTLIAASIDQLVDLGIKRRYVAAVEHYWPGSVSVVISVGDASLGYLHQGVGSLAMRVIADDTTRAILQRTGPLITSSANTPGEPPAKNIEQAKRYFDNRVDFYVDGGLKDAAAASTIIRVVDDAVEILRQGSVTIDEATGRLIQ